MVSDEVCVDGVSDSVWKASPVSGRAHGFLVVRFREAALGGAIKYYKRITLRQTDNVS